MSVQTLDAAIANFARRLHAADPLFPDLARVRKRVLPDPRSCEALADNTRKIAIEIITAADLLRHEALSELAAQQPREEEGA